jgi:hypothetical protein
MGVAEKPKAHGRDLDGHDALIIGGDCTAGCGFHKVVVGGR